jgi:hypothetical protein
MMRSKQFLPFATIMMLFLLLQMQSAWLLLHGSQWSHQAKTSERLHAGLVEGDLVTMRFPLEWMDHPPADLEWEHEREFVLHGRWYDVVDSYIEGNEVILMCEFDKEDTRIAEALDGLQRLWTQDSEEGRLVDFVVWSTAKYLPSDHTVVRPYEELVSVFSRRCLDYHHQRFGRLERPPSVVV